MSAINIGTRRECFWDDYLVDTDKTSAFPRAMQPVKKEYCFYFDTDIEKKGLSYPCLVKDDKGYKLYYRFNSQPGSDHAGELAVIESTDGLTWTRPQFENGNIVMPLHDSMYVFYDPNPDCPEDEKYKAVGCNWERYGDNPKRGGLWCYVSRDGYSFKCHSLMTIAGVFDSLNTVQWKDGKYSCYFRNYHNVPGDMKNGVEDVDRLGEVLNENWEIPGALRDIRVMYSTDFKTWTKPERITFNDDNDIQLYTNNIEYYERAPHIMIGFPVRYSNRADFTDNEAQMVSSRVKYAATQLEAGKRGGTAVTDSIFMHSRDGKLWHRTNEAFLTPGYEREHNWVYGDCYLAYGMIDSGKENYYMYSHEYHRSPGLAKPLARYEIRKDGFACYMADGKERMLVTKPIIFDGKDLHINFETSPFGYIFIDVLDEDGKPLSGNESFEIYGNNIDRKISFADGTDFAGFAGKPVRLRFRMLDAKLYSMKFE